ncbi:hypothetical protein PLESTB_000816300 [Pleodorina starrii]|uniref:Cyclic nucleotide-binding domain-containing protein n=1 Tax=Pleodorina starrii TaxID=330485 RepID=A0A9W6F384_9CHLO|nr:hypothetical protein PLESTM_000132000 [Pleodorina starrii]GLC54031.1 hypothetical protein PLESTB_000816300 [Pleodorina starrii]GLC64663.1 hypothetical protein PLESTF_000190000 [Pleodorina starrii]
MPSAASVTAKRTAGPGGESHSARPFVSALAARGGLGTSTHLCLLTKWSWKAWDLLVWLVDTALPVALPTSPARTWWTVWFLLLVLYSAVDVPLHIAFESWRRLQPVTCLSWLCCVTFCVDIIVRFRTSHVTSQGEVIRTPRLVALNYLRGMFLLDLVSALPLDEIIDLLLGGQGHHNAYWVGLLRIPRLFITMRQLNRIIPVKYYNLANVAKLLGAMLLSTHWAACMWYYLAFDEVRGNWPWIFTAGGCSGCSSDLGRYLFAFYRCFLILLGDRPQAYNNVERIFVLVLLLLGACLYAVIMGSMTLLVSNMWSMASRHKQRAAMLQDALRYNGASAGTDLRSRVDQYFDFMATHEHPGAEGLALLSELPTALHSELMSTVFEPLLTRVQLFAYCERAFVWRLAQRLRLATFMPKDILYGVNSVGHDMYIIWRGNVALTEPDGCMTALLCEGDHFGELGVMAANTPRPQRAVALCAADVLILSRGDIQDAMRDFPDSAQLVKSRARVQLEDHEIGPAVWAATMAMCKDMKEAGDDSSDVPSPPSCSAERPKSALPQAPNPHSSVLGTDGSGGTSSTDNMAASSAQKSPWPRPDVICRRRQEGAPAASFWRRQYLLGQVQGDAAEGRAASPGPVAEAMETGADGSQHVGATSLTSMGGTALDSRDVDSRRRPSSLSSEDSFLEALGLKAEAAAGPGDGGAPVGVQGAWAAGDKPSAAPSTPRWKPPRLPARVSRRAGCPTSALVLEELLVEPRQSVMGSNPTLGEPGPVQQRTQHDAGVVPQANRNMLGDDVGSLRGGSRAATATSHAGLQFWMASVQPCSATSGTPLKQQQHQQQSSHPTANLCGFDPRELAALERVRATSTRPVDPGGVIRYLSKRARQEAGAAAVPSSGPFAAAGAAPGNPSGGGPGPQVAATCLSAAPTGEDSSCWRGVTQEFDVHDLVEVPSSSAGQQSPPTAPQLLFMTPQPFLGADPLGPLFDQPAPALGGVSSMLGLRWRGRSPRLTTVTGDGTLPSAPFGGTEDSRTRQLVAPVCRRSIRSVLRGSGRRVSGSSLGKYASAGSSERGIDEWLNDQQQATCHQPRCAELEQQVSQLRRQLAAAHARLETILEDPLKAVWIRAQYSS